MRLITREIDGKRGSEMKYLGKITRAEFGTIKGMNFLMGLQLTFAFDGSGVSTGGRYCVNTSSHWKFDDDRQYEITKSWDFIHKILKEAKVNYVSELIGKPVEVELDGNVFKNFRILTEVI